MPWGSVGTGRARPEPLCAREIVSLLALSPSHRSYRPLRCEDGHKPLSSGFYLARPLLREARSLLREWREIESETLHFSPLPMEEGRSMGLILTHGLLNMDTPIGLMNYTTCTIGLQRSGSHFLYRKIKELTPSYSLLFIVGLSCVGIFRLD